MGESQLKHESFSPFSILIYCHGSICNCGLGEKKKNVIFADPVLETERDLKLEGKEDSSS